MHGVALEFIVEENETNFRIREDVKVAWAIGYVHNRYLRHRSVNVYL
jgi:hypothetical protein